MSFYHLSQFTPLFLEADNDDAYLKRIPAKCRTSSASMFPTIENRVQKA